MIEGEEQELILNTLAEQPQEEIRTLEEDIYVIGVESLNGQAGDLTLKNINGEDLVGEGNIALQTPLTETQMDAVDSGIDSTKVAQIATNAGDITTLQNTKQDNLTQTQLNAVNSGIDQTKVAQIATNTGNITSNTNRISTIEGKIPSAASSSNQLTDKNYVDNSIATNTANYISDNGQPFQSYADLVAYSGTLTNNDYAFVVSTDAAGNLLYTRYKYNADQNLWAEEYTIANPTFTSDQWASINSGVTANDVSQIGTNKTDIATLTTSKQDALSQTQLDAVNSGINATKVQQIADNTTAIATKQDKLVAGTNIQIAADGKTISATDTKYTAGTGLTLTGTQFSVTEPVPAGFFTDTASTQEGEGTQFTLNNTTDAPIDGVELKGDTFQQTYSGKNLFNGILELGYINGTNGGNGSSDQYIRAKDYIPVKELTDYKISCDNANITSVFVYEYKADKSYNLTSNKNIGLSSYLTTNADTAYIRFRPATQTTDTSIKFQVEEGTVATAYEPYVGGIPSPNPDYPQDIQVVTGEQTVSVMGKNIWNPTAYQENHFIAANGTESTNTSTNTWGNIYVPAGTSMAVSATPGTSVSTAIRVHAFTLNGVWKEQLAVLTLSGGNYGSATFTTPNEPILLRWCGAKNLASYQLEYNTAATTYQPYESQSYTIDLGTIELCKIGTYQDYIWKDGADWKVHKEVGGRIYSGEESEGWGVSSTGTTSFFYYANISPSANNAGTPQSLRSNYGSYGNVGLNNTTEGINMVASGTAFRLRYGPEISLVDWKAKLTSTPMTFYYALFNPTDTVITDAALIAQLEALAGSTTYAPQTNYATAGTGTNLPVILTVDVFKNNYAGLLARLEKAGA